MKFLLLSVLAVAAIAFKHEGADSVNPVEKVLSLLSDLEGKIVREGQEAQKTFSEFSAWCEDRSKNVGFEIKDGRSEVEQQKATIDSSSSEITALSSKIEELAGSLTTDESDLKSATGIRAEEASTYQATEKDLVETIDILQRAILILEKEMKKGGAAMVQVQKAGNNLVRALSAMVDASMINTQDASKLTALVQSESGSDDDDSEQGAPAAAAYEGHSSGIIGTMEDLFEKAKASLANARGKEQSSMHNFQMLKQSLEDEIKFANKDMSATKKSLAEMQGSKAQAQGDLSVASNGLKEDTETLSTLHSDCLEKSQDFEAETKSRAEELKALAVAKKAIIESTSGADSLTYGLNQEEVSAMSFFQIDLDQTNEIHTGADLANFEAVHFIRDLARKTNDKRLSQLAIRMSAAMHNTRAGEDPFAKVKELIKNMLETLLSDAQADATHKAYCDKELGQSGEKKAEKIATVDKLSTKIDSMSSKSAILKEQVAVLQKELAEIASTQSEMTSIRTSEKGNYRSAKKEMEEGIKGVQMALKVLRDYYAQDASHSAADGAGSGIVGMLEVVESDFTKGLAEMNVAEQTSASHYDKETQENKISRATKDSDVKYKTKESKGLDQSVAEAKSDRATTQEELGAIVAYLGKLDSICIAKPESYGERKGRREAELSGLKEALKILQGETVLLQQKAGLRGTRRHVAA